MRMVMILIVGVRIMRLKVGNMILRVMVIRWGRRILMPDKLQDHISFIFSLPAKGR